MIFILCQGFVLSKNFNVAMQKANKKHVNNTHTGRSKSLWSVLLFKDQERSRSKQHTPLIYRASRIRALPYLLKNYLNYIANFVGKIFAAIHTSTLFSISDVSYKFLWAWISGLELIWKAGSNYFSGAKVCGFRGQGKTSKSFCQKYLGIKIGDK